MVDNKKTDEYIKKKIDQDMNSIKIPDGLKEEIWQNVQSKRKKNFLKFIPYVAMIACLVILIPLGLNLAAMSEGKSASKATNVEVFARIYGYVRYFHPSDEVSDLDWDQFAVYGVNRVKQTKNDKELVAALNELFTPFAPTMSISTQKDMKKNSAIKVPKNAVLVMWKHLLEGNSFEYSSERIYSANSKSIKLFNKTFKYGENTINKKIGNIYISIPTVLYSSSNKTLGSTLESKKKFKRLESNMEQYNEKHDIAYDNEDVRIANVIISWNTFEHFYPYFDEIQVNWLSQLSKSLQEMKKVKNEEGVYEVMRSMVTKLGDGNIGYIQNLNPNEVLIKLPISVKYIEGKLVVTYSEVKKILPGDVLLTIDGKDALNEFKKIMNQTSGTTQWKELQASFNLLLNQDPTEVKLTLKRKGDTIGVIAPYNNYKPQKYIDYSYNQKNDFVELERGIFYINFFSDDYLLDDYMMSKMIDAKGIVVDMRGYPRGNNPLEFLSHLTKSKLNSARFLKLQALLPDHNSANGYENVTWSIEPKLPQIKGKVVFLTDERSIGSSETIMGIVEHYKLGEIVGEPTAGTNGNVTLMVLPGGMHFYWTALKVVKHDGSQHHDVGILPTVPVKSTMKGITENRDEQLEAALKIIKRK